MVVRLCSYLYAPEQNSPSCPWKYLSAKPGMNFAFSRKSISPTSNFFGFLIISFSMQNDYFLFTRLCAFQIDSILAPCIIFQISLIWVQYYRDIFSFPPMQTLFKMRLLRKLRSDIKRMIIHFSFRRETLYGGQYF